LRNKKRKKKGMDMQFQKRCLLSQHNTGEKKRSSELVVRHSLDPHTGASEIGFMIEKENETL